jgi:hypothetical protein
MGHQTRLYLEFDSGGVRLGRFVDAAETIVTPGSRRASERTRVGARRHD